MLTLNYKYIRTKKSGDNVLIFHDCWCEYAIACSCFRKSYKQRSNIRMSICILLLSPSTRMAWIEIIYGVDTFLEKLSPSTRMAWIEI